METMKTEDCIYNIKLEVDTSGIDEAQKKADKLRDTLTEVHELIRGLDSNITCSD